ncbi:MAG: N-acetylmuramoyl-L-alanine amidase [Sphingobacteriaceae bacterium]|nr:N-acetylmuramoyl-L-alanine amidase [Sphingobacteriaceae bacterium]
MKNVVCLAFTYLLYFSFHSAFSQAPLTENKLPVFRIVLDPGHGGKDSVTRSDGYQEKHIVLGIAMEVRNYLEESGFEVIMTRETDEFISLPARAAFKGDIFISLHTNTVADTIGESVRSMIKGMEIYTDKSMETVELLNRSKVLASAFRIHLAGLQGVKMRGVRQKPLAVLNKNQSPAILIELGFISNKDDLAYLTNPDNYKEIAKAIVNAVKAYQLEFTP